MSLARRIATDLRELRWTHVAVELARDLDQDIVEFRAEAAFEDRQASDGVTACRALHGTVHPAEEEAVAEALAG